MPTGPHAWLALLPAAQAPLGPVAVTSTTEGREPDAQVAQGEEVQIPGAATGDLPGLGSEQPGALPLAAQPRVLLDDALANCIGYLIAAQAEHVDGCAGR